MARLSRQSARRARSRSPLPMASVATGTARRGQAHPNPATTAPPRARSRSPSAQNRKKPGGSASCPIDSLTPESRQRQPASPSYDVMIEIIQHPGQNNDCNRQVEFVPDVDEHLHILTEYDADIGQEIAPNQGADEGERTKNEKVCSENAGWK